MAKYQANPVVVDAYKIVGVGEIINGGLDLRLDNEELVRATPEMMSRMQPVVGDYWVVQADGYTYLNPKEVFERKYRPVEERPAVFFEYLDPADCPVAEGFPEVVYAKHQPQYRPLRTLRSQDEYGRVMSRWTLTPEQRKAVAEGADIFLTLLTFNNPLQPITLAVGDKPSEECLRHFTVKVPVMAEEPKPPTDAEKEEGAVYSPPPEV